MRQRRVVILSVLSALSLAVGLLAASGGASAAPARNSAIHLAPRSGTNPPGVTSSSLSQGSPTFVGSAATGCNYANCSLLTGPYPTPAISPGSSSSSSASTNVTPSIKSNAATNKVADVPHVVPGPHKPADGPDPTPPTVTCPGAGCDAINASAPGVTAVKGLNAVDSGTLSTNTTIGDLEPADQGLCAGNGYVVEDNNLGEILAFDTALHRVSSVISLDTMMGLTKRNWSSGGDISCTYDYQNGGHWFFTEIVSASSEANDGPFASNGCFEAAANACYEGIAVTTGNSPFGPYNVYFLHADYNPAEPGYPNLLNDFAKIATTQDAFLVFYDEFPLAYPSNTGFGGGAFNGAQEFAFDKTALEQGMPAANVNVAIENMGLLPTPDGGCPETGGVTCWYQVIPAQAADPSQYDNSHGGSGFMLASLDFVGQGDDRVAAFDWTGLSALNSSNCTACGQIAFGGTLFSGVEFYYGEAFLGAQKQGPIPLGDVCAAVQLPTDPSPPSTCPENGIATNGDGMTQAAQAQGQLWGAISTEVNQVFGHGSRTTSETHQGAAYWVINTQSFDQTGQLSLTGQGYVSAAHEDLEFPAIAATDQASSGPGAGQASALMTFTLSGDGVSDAATASNPNPNNYTAANPADHGGFYPSTVYGLLNSTSNGLIGSQVNIADLGQSPQDGFTEYQQLPPSYTGTRPRWGDYSWAVFVPGSGPGGGAIYFATNYIQYPNCTGSAFSATGFGICGGHRDGMANWGTSVNSLAFP